MYKFTVPIPDDKGKICKQTTKSAVYIHYVVKRYYDPEKGYSVPIRVIIGKRCKDDETMMYPNENFFKFYPDAVLPEQRQTANRSSTIQAGPYVVIDKVARDYQLYPLLEKHFGDDAGLMIDLASYMIVEGKNQGQYYPDYAYRHPLFTPDMRVLSDATISNFLSTVGEEQISGFLNDWNARQDHRSRIYISYDSTNKNSQAGDVDFVEFGKAKDEKGLPVFNISAAFDKTNQVPLFYELYPGSINDVSQFRYFVDKAVSYNYRRIGFILDRGYFSRANIEYMDKNGYEFILMVKGCKPLTSSLIDEVHGTFEHLRSASIPHQRLSGTTVRRRLFEDDKKERFFHVFFSPFKMAEERAAFEDKLAQMSVYLSKCLGKQITFDKPYTTYFKLSYNDQGKLLGAQEKTEVIEREILRCGYFCLVTSEKMTAQEAYAIYKGRDASEKLFSADKSFLGSRSMRVHSQRSVEAKILIEFLALIIRNRIYNLLKEQMQKLPVPKNYMTVPAALRELSKIELVRINDGRYQLDHALTRSQQLILSSFGLSVEDVKVQCGIISSMLTAGDKVAGVKGARHEHEEDEEDYFAED